MEQLQALMHGTLTDGLYLGNYALKKGFKVQPLRPGSKGLSEKESKERLGSQQAQSRTGTALTQHEEVKLGIYKHNLVTIGVPLLRVQ